MRRHPEVLVWVLFAGTALAQPRNELQGPVTVTADRAEWLKGGAMSYQGAVSLSSEALQLHGEKMDLKQLPGGQFEAQVSGEPARLDHSDEAGNPPLAAQARLLTYDSRRQYVQLDGAVRLERGADRMSGESIRYDIAARRIQAAGAGGAQVKIEIVPPPREDSGPRKRRRK